MPYIPTSVCMDILQTKLFDNTLLAWLTALGIALSINLIVGILKWAIINRLSVIAKRSVTELDDSLIDIVNRTRQTLVFVVTLFIGSNYLELGETTQDVLAGAATIAIFIQVGLWLVGGLDFWLVRYKNRTLEANAGAATAVAAIGFIGRLVLWAMLFLLALANLGVDVTAMVAGLGVGGIAVALAVQNILGDLFASLSIIVDKPFVLGDFVVVDEFSGTIEHVGLKTTRMRSLSGEQLVFSNSDLLKARLRNYKRMNERRIAFAFGVIYQTRPELLKAIPGIVRQIVEQNDNARFDRCHFKTFGASSLDFEVVFWMKTPDYAAYMDVQQSINLALFEQFAEQGIEFAYPTQTLFVEGPVQFESKPSTD